MFGSRTPSLQYLVSSPSFFHFKSSCYIFFSLFSPLSSPFSSLASLLSCLISRSASFKIQIQTFLQNCFIHSRNAVYRAVYPFLVVRRRDSVPSLTTSTATIPEKNTHQRIVLPPCTKYIPILSHIILFDHHTIIIIPHIPLIHTLPYIHLSLLPTN